MQPIRIPRPKNLTSLSQQLRESNEETKVKAKREITDYIASLYLSNQIHKYLNPIPNPSQLKTERTTNKDKLKRKISKREINKSSSMGDSILSIEQLADKVGIGYGYMVKRINRWLEKHKDGLEIECKEISRAAIFSVFKNCLDDRHEALLWYTELVNQYGASNGGKMPALLAAQVNGAMGNRMASNNNIIGLLQKMPAILNIAQKASNSQNIQIQNNLNQPNQTTENRYLTVDAATNLLTQKGLSNPTDPNTLFLTEGLADTPEILANITDAQGMNLGKDKDGMFTTHSDRRQEEYSVVEDE